MQKHVNKFSPIQYHSQLTMQNISIFVLCVTLFEIKYRNSSNSHLPALFSSPLEQQPPQKSVLYMQQQVLSNSSLPQSMQVHTCNNHKYWFYIVYGHKIALLLVLGNACICVSRQFTFINSMTIELSAKLVQCMYLPDDNVWWQFKLMNTVQCQIFQAHNFHGSCI